MMRNWKQIATLAGLLVALGGLATWDEWKTKKDEKDKETKGLVMTIKPDTVTGLTFHSSGETETVEKTVEKTAEKTADKSADKSAKKVATQPVDIKLVLQNGTWQIVSPIATLADQQAVKDLIKNVTEYKTESEVATSKTQWQPFGLTTPRRSLELETNDGKKTQFLIGINAPVGFNVYTATNLSEAVYTGSQYIVTSTAKSLFDLREKKILTLPANEIVGVELTNAQGTVELAKNDGKWSFQKPLSTAADTATTNNLVDDILGLKAVDFVDAGDKKISDALKSKNLWSQIRLKKVSDVTTIKIADVSGSLFAQVNNTSGDGPIVKLADDVKPKLSKTVNDLRDKKIFTFNAAVQSKITIDGEVFKKVGGEWYSATEAAKFGGDGKFTGKPEDQPKSANHIRGLLVDLEYAKAEDVYESDSKVAKDLPKAPKHHITFNASEKDPELAVDIWLAQDNSEMIYLRQSTSPKIFKSKRTVISSLTPAKSVPVGNEALPAAIK